MKVKVELTTEVMHAIGRNEASMCADGWWGGCMDLPLPDIETVQTLYEYAFADGMEWLLNAIKEEVV